MGFIRRIRGKAVMRGTLPLSFIVALMDSYSRMDGGTDYCWWLGSRSCCLFYRVTCRVPVRQVFLFAPAGNQGMAGSTSNTS
ncbi:uncharacterized protein BO96DRAFT_101234 [Aspergillus niger CBS 101883]|uniref:uncharacterized protein n=1 Tax=Aspergillus lacticoffeatus (strain CBS 101883) TaxID=1450533 RepID=UPI000D7EB88E|nr:uncharacterized protein BO96DRAFT_101234 [Aspergillus niger CBS 101883]PYH61611.1 hypothetical protein BO96DRAFT_101234 [Aspergillus niger CBS 101883]